MGEATPAFQSDRRLRWYRPRIDRKELTALSRRSDLRGFVQALGHLGLWGLTGALAYTAFLQVSAANWFWSVPLLYVALFAHGSVGGFMGGASCHELGHRTAFRTRALNDLFLKVFAFFSWWDHVGFRPSHIKHHQHTTFHDHDGEVVLPLELSLADWQLWLQQFAWNPVHTWNLIRVNAKRAMGHMDNPWHEFCMPPEKVDVRRRHRNRARLLLVGHALLAVVFIATGHWFLIFIVNLGTQYCSLLSGLCGIPQHFGMQPDVPDHRLCCRTYITRGLPAFLYWNMQYHVEHHMFPSVPFFNLPRLRKVIERELPPARRGLRATWAHILEVRRRQQADSDYYYVPQLPVDAGGERASDLDLEQEASGSPTS
ncbi:MAG: hypothetical protein CMJ18_22550 [Phycisphaeraceae bacterium]|nr:hypothetical protein [Phycisphaeraceae bacterium]